MIIKGKREPVRSYQALSLRSAEDIRLDYGQLQSPLIGRDRELIQLAGSLSRLQAGRGQIICLTGEGGIGKSRLIREISSLRNDFQLDLNWYQTEAYSFEGLQPYGLIQRLLRRVGGIARDDSPQRAAQKITLLSASLPPQRRLPAANVLAALFGVDSAEGQTQPQGEDFKRELFDGVRALVQTWPAEKPMVLVFEDLQWTDPASVELISHLLPIANEFPLLMVCVLRPYANSPGWTIRQHAQNILPERFQEITLKPLTVEASNSLVRSLLSTVRLPEQIGTLIAEKTSGVPYFIEEIVRDLIERGALIFTDDTREWHVAGDNLEIEIPDSLEAALVSLYHGRGRVFAVLGRFDDACNDYETALRTARRAGDDKLVSRILLDLKRCKPYTTIINGRGASNYE